MTQTTTFSQPSSGLALLEDVVFRYNNGEPVLNRLSFQIRIGEFVALMGPSGCGKTTFLYVLGGLREPANGRVVRNFKKAGLVHQDDGLLPWLTVEQNVEFPLRLSSSRADGVRVRDAALSVVSASGFRTKLPHELSGGMKRRVEIARLIAADADLWLLDEPFEGLDFISRQELLGLLSRESRSRYASVVLVTHNVDDALASADRIVVLTADGAVAGSLVLTQPAPRRVDDASVQVYRRDLLQILFAKKGQMA